MNPSPVAHLNSGPGRDPQGPRAACQRGRPKPQANPNTIPMSHDPTPPSDNRPQDPQTNAPEDAPHYEETASPHRDARRSFLRSLGTITVLTAGVFKFSAPIGALPHQVSPKELDKCNQKVQGGGVTAD